MTAKDDAISALREAKTAVLAELRQIDDALLALGALTVRDTVPGARGKAPTLINKVLTVMEQEDKTWSADAMLDALTADNFPGLNPRDPKAGIRVTFRRLATKGLVADAGYGKWKASKWTVYDPSKVDDGPAEGDWADYEPSAEELLEMENEARAREEEERAASVFPWDPAKEPF